MSSCGRKTIDHVKFSDVGWSLLLASDEGAGALSPFMELVMVLNSSSKFAPMLSGMVFFDCSRLSISATTSLERRNRVHISLSGVSLPSRTKSRTVSNSCAKSTI